jgi:hypothetical protein
MSSFIPFRKGKLLPLAFVSLQHFTLVESPDRSVFFMRVGSVYMRSGLMEEMCTDVYVLADMKERLLTSNVQMDGSLGVEDTPPFMRIKRIVEQRVLLSVALDAVERSDVIVDAPLGIEQEEMQAALGRVQIAGAKFLRTVHGWSALDEEVAGSTGCARLRNESGVLVHAVQFSHAGKPVRIDSLRPLSDDVLFTLDSSIGRDGVPDGLSKARRLAMISSAEKDMIRAEFCLKLNISPQDIADVDMARIVNVVKEGQR